MTHVPSPPRLTPRPPARLQGATGKWTNLGRFNDEGQFQPGPSVVSQIHRFKITAHGALPQTQQFLHDLKVAAVCKEIEGMGSGALVELTVGPKPGRELLMRRDGWHLIAWDVNADPPPVDLLLHPLAEAGDVPGDPDELRNKLVESHFAPRQAAERRKRTFRVTLAILGLFVCVCLALVVPTRLVPFAWVLGAGFMVLAGYFLLAPLPVVGPDPETAKRAREDLTRDPW